MSSKMRNHKYTRLYHLREKEDWYEEGVTSVTEGEEEKEGEEEEEER